MTAPILAVDVDGVLNALSRGEPDPDWRDTQVTAFGHSLRIRHNPAHGAQLLAIAAETGAELVWCTTWEEMAVQRIAPLVGLPDMPWVPMAPGFAGLRFTECRSVGYTKARAMAAYAGDRPFCWLDDEPDAALELLGHPVPHLVVQVEPMEGLQDEHFEQARQWLGGLRATVAA